MRCSHHRKLGSLCERTASNSKALFLQICPHMTCVGSSSSKKDRHATRRTKLPYGARITNHGNLLMEMRKIASLYKCPALLLMAARDPTTKMLKERAVLLSHAWKVFRQTIPKNEQENFEGQAPSVEGLVGMVDIVARAWQNKRTTSKTGKFVSNFTGFCETLKSHSYMLEILPDGSEYVSLFTGTLKTIINVSPVLIHTELDMNFYVLIPQRLPQITRRLHKDSGKHCPA